MIKPVKQYGIYLVCLDPAIGSEMKKTRPVVVVSQDNMNKNLDTVVVCPLTSSIHEAWRSRIQFKSKGKLSEIAVDQIRTVSKKRIVKKLDAVTDDVAKQLRMVITEMYGESN